MKITRNKTVEYVLKSERELPESEQTVFKIRELGAIERANFTDIANEEQLGNIESSVIYTQRSIVDIINLKDDDGEDIPFIKSPRGDYVSTELINQFPSEVLSELALFCAELGGLIETEKK